MSSNETISGPAAIVVDDTGGRSTGDVTYPMANNVVGQSSQDFYLRQIADRNGRPVSIPSNITSVVLCFSLTKANSPSHYRNGPQPIMCPD